MWPGNLIEAAVRPGYHLPVTAIQATFDGKSFVPKQPVALPVQSEALVIVDGTDPTARDQLDQAVRDYYQNGPDADDDAWGNAIAPDSHRAWDED